MTPIDPTMPQPAPTGDGTRVVDLVLRDISEKSDRGAAKYGTVLKTRNGRRALVDAYQEQLDLVMYLRQQLEEDREVASAARAAALEDVVALAEALLQEPGDLGTELGRMAAHGNGTLRRLITRVRALQGLPPPEPTPAAQPQRHRWRKVAEKVFRCAHCPMEKHLDRGPQHGIVLVFRLEGRELARGPSPQVRVPPCRPGVAS
jgi:hypothetical protein